MEREPMEREQGQPSGSTPRDPGSDDQGAQPAAPRRFGASRIRPRVEFGAPRPRPYIAPDDASSMPQQEPPGQGPFGSAFGTPREFAGGRVRLYGCSPGCLIAALVVSVVASCVLTALANGI